MQAASFVCWEVLKVDLFDLSVQLEAVEFAPFSSDDAYSVAQCSWRSVEFAPFQVMKVTVSSHPSHANVVLRTFHRV